MNITLWLVRGRCGTKDRLWQQEEAVRRRGGWPVKRCIHVENKCHMFITVPEIKVPLNITSALYGSHPVVFTIKQTTLILTQHQFI